MSPRFLSPLKTFILLGALMSLLTACITNRSFGDGVDDTGADLNLKSVLLTDRNHDYADIDITVFEGRMLLTGTMPSDEGKAHLGNLAANTEGVTEVINEVVVGRKTSIGQSAEDVIIDERLSARFLADREVIRGNYKVVVSDNTVFLLGLAQNAEELKRATDWARQTPGVKKVVSHVLYVGDNRRAIRK